jgi:hypothetical protein
MGLPKIALPTAKYTLPDAGYDVKMRPMVGQEFEIMLMAKESDDIEDHINAVYDMIDAVVTHPADFKSSTLSPLDFDFVFTKLIVTSYARSNIDTAFKCKTKDSEGKTCGEVLNISVNLTDEVSFENGEFEFKSEYDLAQYKLVVDKPSTRHILKTKMDVFEAVAVNVSKLVDTTTGQEWNFKGSTPDVTSDERDEFIRGSVPSTIIREIAENIQKSPRMTYESSIKCKSCGTTHKIKLNGFTDFFGYASPHTT